MSLLASLTQDLAYSARMIRRGPAFTAAVVLTLALGIGATTAIFTVVNGVLLRPLPYAEPDRLVYIAVSLRGEKFSLFSYTRDFAAWRKYNRTLSSLAGFMGFHATLTGGDQAERVSCGLATQSLFPLLAVRPALGRNFLPEEDRPGAPPVAILDDQFWKSRFGADPSVIGRTILLDDQSYTVVGVLPPRFRIPESYGGGSRYDLWAPFAIGETGKAREILLHAIGRLKPGVTREAARAELDSLMRAQLRRADKRFITVTPWHEQVASGSKRSLILFLAAVGCVLLIACVNVANLLLSRAAGRQKEFAVRLALGAGRSRLVRQLLTESIAMALIGGVVALALAHWATDLLLLVLSSKLPALDPVRLDHRVLLFNFALALATGIAFGMAPALHAIRFAPNVALKQSSRGSGEGRSSRRFRGMLAVIEVALAMVLLTGAGLLLKSFLQLRGVDMGFRTDRIITFNVSLTASRYPKPLDRAHFLKEALQRIERVPGVRSAAGGEWLPLTGGTMGITGMKIEGQPGATFDVSGTTVSPGYFDTMGIPLLRGRDFSTADREGEPGVVIVNQAFVSRNLPDGRDIGRRIDDPNHKNSWLTIVGVVSDVRAYPEQEPAPQIYLSAQQPGDPNVSRTGDAFSTIVLRAAGDPLGLVPAVRSEIAGLDRDLPLYGLATLEQLRGNWIAPHRITMLLIAVFAALALALGVIGIYGVLSWTVGQRTREIGVRLALGAHQGQILAMVLRNGMGLIAAGIAIGIVASLGVGRVLSSELWGVSPTDPWTFLAVASVLAITGLAACSLPARRAIRVDPVLALRSE
jgi:putative ABC transport system permease protein